MLSGWVLDGEAAAEVVVVVDEPDTAALLEVELETTGLVAEPLWPVEPFLIGVRTFVEGAVVVGAAAPDAAGGGSAEVLVPEAS
jgi:hypothetical protein